MQLTTCSKPAVHNLQQVCSSQFAASLQFTICSKSAVHNLQQVCSSQLAASLQFAICSKSAVHNLQQVCSSQLAASLLTTCSRLVVIKPKQAMRTHPDIGLMIASCSKSAADLLQLARFWLCRASCVHLPLGRRSYRLNRRLITLIFFMEITSFQIVKYDYDTVYILFITIIIITLRHSHTRFSLPNYKI